jgi:hypothetical protein
MKKDIEKFSGGGVSTENIGVHNPIVIRMSLMNGDYSDLVFDQTMKNPPALVPMGVIEWR